MLATMVALGLAANYPEPASEDTSRFGHGLARTMRLLATSTPTHRNTVRVLYYGQSITQRSWTDQVTADLKKRFPYANLIAENRAIGGFASGWLVRTAEHDVYSYYPDLIVMQDYGGEPEYEQMVRNFRSRTTADLLLLSDHGPVRQPGDDARREDWHDQHGFVWLPNLVRQIGGEVVDVRGQWRRYLTDNKLTMADVTVDGTHLNAQGSYVMARLVERHLRYDPSAPVPNGLTQEFKPRWKDNRVTLKFAGNRIDAIGTGDGVAEVRIDGKKPSEFPELYTVSRPLMVGGSDIPPIRLVTAKGLPVAQDWTLTLTDAGDPKAPVFSVEGSKSGRIGTVKAGEDYTAPDASFTIAAQDWNIDYGYAAAGNRTPKVGDVFRWSVQPQFVESYTSGPAAVTGVENATTLAQGVANGEHTLELTLKSGKIKLDKLRAYKPPL